MSNLTYTTWCHRHTAGSALQPSQISHQLHTATASCIIFYTSSSAAVIILLVSQSPSVEGYTHNGSICDSARVSHLQRCLLERIFIKLDASVNSVTVQPNHLPPPSPLTLYFFSAQKSVFKDEVKGGKHFPPLLLGTKQHKRTRAGLESVNALWGWGGRPFLAEL